MTVASAARNGNMYMANNGRDNAFKSRRAVTSSCIDEKYSPVAT